MTDIAVPKDAAGVADEAAIRELVARYADAVVDRDEKAWASTWAEDASWHVMGNSSQGREQTVALWNQLMATLKAVVQIAHSGSVELDGDSASGRWTIAEYGHTQDGKAIFLIGCYRDRYRREAAGWRFVERRMEPLYAGPPDLSGTLLGNTLG